MKLSLKSVACAGLGLALLGTSPREAFAQG